MQHPRVTESANSKTNQGTHRAESSSHLVLGVDDHALVELLAGRLRMGRTAGTDSGELARSKQIQTIMTGPTTAPSRQPRPPRSEQSGARLAPSPLPSPWPPSTAAPSWTPSCPSWPPRGACPRGSGCGWRSADATIRESNEASDGFKACSEMLPGLPQRCRRGQAGGRRVSGPPAAGAADVSQ